MTKITLTIKSHSCMCGKPCVYEKAKFLVGALEQAKEEIPLLLNALSRHIKKGTNQTVDSYSLITINKTLTQWENK